MGEADAHFGAWRPVGDGLTFGGGQAGSGDELIVDHIGDLCHAALYLSDFGDEDDEQRDFDYRMDNIDEDIESVEYLIALDGESFKVANLPTKDELLNSRRAVAG